MRASSLWVAWLLFGAVAGLGQAKATAAGSLVRTVSIDTDLDVAKAEIGRSLFLRGFYQSNDLSYDATGKVEGSPKLGDWTLAAMDIQKAERKGPGRIQLDGVRVAIRYNPDQHIFERHPQKDESLRVTVADTGDVKAFSAALRAIFAMGIDPGLQQAMPDFWQHYFNPATPWPADGLVGKPILNAGGQALPADATYAVADKKVEPKMTAFALRDHIRGTVQVRMTVDEEGVPRRIGLVLPLGYGLDERVIEAVRQWRFRPAMRQGKAVASVAVVNQVFE